MRIATGDAVVLLDGDLQDPPELIEEFFAKWREGYDVVYGERVRREAPRLHAARLQGLLPRFPPLSYVHVPLDAGDFSLIDRRVVDALNALPENEPLPARAARVGRLPADRRAVRAAGADVRAIDELVASRTSAGRAQAIVSFSYAPLDLITWLALSTVGFSVRRDRRCRSSLRFVAPDSAPRGLHDAHRASSCSSAASSFSA